MDLKNHFLLNIDLLIFYLLHFQINFIGFVDVDWKKLSSDLEEFIFKIFTYKINKNIKL